MDCEKCGGSGWIVIERDGLSAAERCGCAETEIRPNLEPLANIPPRYEDASLDSFVFRGLPPDKEEALRQIHLKLSCWIREFPFVPKPGLLFLGGIGTGKTHLAVAALRKLIERGFEGLFFDYINLLEKVRSGYDADAAPDDREAYRRCLDVPVLLIDDLGSHRVLPWIEDTLTAIVTHRCNYKKALIITTNLVDFDAGDVRYNRADGITQVDVRKTIGEMIGERARSRLFEICEVIRMPAVGDYRVRRK